MKAGPGAWLILPVIGALSWRVTKWVADNAPRLGLVQSPNARSSHRLPTPHGGGTGIVLAASVAVLWPAWGDRPAWLLPTLLLSLVIAGIGLWDDIRPMPALPRLSVHALACVCALAVSHFSAGIGWSILLLLGGVWWLNLFNFMDGIDGLAGAQALFMLWAAAGLAVGFEAGAAGYVGWQWMVLSGAAVAGFLFWNWPPAKIFMGDVGSTYLGFMLFVFCLVSVGEGWLSIQVWLILAALFVTDSTVTIVRRILRGEAWSTAHRQHLYQRMARKWGSHRAITLAAAGVNLFFLTPVAMAAMHWPGLSWTMVAAAYVPLVAMAVALQDLGAD